MFTIYIIGVVIAAILGFLLLIIAEKENRKKEKKDNLQPGMVAALAFMSWFSVIMILLNYHEPLKKLLRNKTI